jgi:hypothetical protein
MFIIWNVVCTNAIQHACVELPTALPRSLPRTSPPRRFPAPCPLPHVYRSSANLVLDIALSWLRVVFTVYSYFTSIVLYIRFSVPFLA